MDISAEISALFAKVAAAFADHDGAPSATPVHFMAAHDHISRAVRQEFDRIRSHREPAAAAAISEVDADGMSELTEGAVIEKQGKKRAVETIPAPSEPAAGQSAALPIETSTTASTVDETVSATELVAEESAKEAAVPPSEPVNEKSTAAPTEATTDAPATETTETGESS